MLKIRNFVKRRHVSSNLKQKMQLEENLPKSKIQILQEEFIEKLKGLTIQEAEFVLKPVLDYVRQNSIVQ